MTVQVSSDDTGFTKDLDSPWLVVIRRGTNQTIVRRDVKSSVLQEKGVKRDRNDYSGNT